MDRERVWDYFVVDKDRVSLFTEEGAMPFEVIGVSELLEIAGYKKKEEEENEQKRN